METRPGILVVDDERDICDTLAFNLSVEGYDVSTAYSAEEALALNLSAFDLILLDIMMDGISGTQLAAILKSNPATAAVPVIFCTARDSEDDMVAGLDLGADDYITKPYSLRNVLARIRTVLRRTSAVRASASGTTTSFRGLVLRHSDKVCVVDGREVRMPRKEFEILLKLVGNRGRIFTRAELLNEIWPDEVVVLDRVVDVNITRIRQKIGSYGKHIVTRTGYGYGFME